MYIAVKQNMLHKHPLWT